MLLQSHHLLEGLEVSRNQDRREVNLFSVCQDGDWVQGQSRTYFVCKFGHVRCASLPFVLVKLYQCSLYLKSMCLQGRKPQATVIEIGYLCHVKDPSSARGIPTLSPRHSAWSRLALGMHPPQVLVLIHMFNGARSMNVIMPYKLSYINFITIRHCGGELCLFV